MKRRAFLLTLIIGLCAGARVPEPVAADDPIYRVLDYNGVNVNEDAEKVLEAVYSFWQDTPIDQVPEGLICALLNSDESCEEPVAGYEICAWAGGDATTVSGSYCAGSGTTAETCQKMTEVGGGSSSAEDGMASVVAHYDQECTWSDGESCNVPMQVTYDWDTPGDLCHQTVTTASFTSGPATGSDTEAVAQIYCS